MTNVKYCWYLNKPTTEKVLTVEKCEGVLFNTYVFDEPPGVYIPRKVKKQVKRALASCPTFTRYHITYDNDIMYRIVGLDKVTLNEHADWVNVPYRADEFWNFLKTERPDILWPTAMEGPWVFNTLQENLDNGKLNGTCDENVVFDRENNQSYYILPV